MARACLVGIDPGERWIGVARAALDSSLALPLGTIDRSEVGISPEALAEALQELLGNDQIEAIIVGAPIRPDGSEDDQATSFRVLGERVAEAMGVPCFTQNERFTSVSREAGVKTSQVRRDRKARRPGGKSRARQRRERERAHAEAAAMILQRWIDERAPTARSLGTGERR